MALCVHTLSHFANERARASATKEKYTNESRSETRTLALTHAHDETAYIPKHVCNNLYGATAYVRVCVCSGYCVMYATNYRLYVTREYDSKSARNVEFLRCASTASFTYVNMHTCIVRSMLVIIYVECVSPPWRLTGCCTRFRALQCTTRVKADNFPVWWILWLRFFPYLTSSPGNRISFGVLRYRWVLYVYIVGK